MANFSSQQEYVNQILSSTVYDVAITTPLELAPLMSSKFHNSVYLKREDMQPVFSFKIRGAYNKINSLDPNERLQKGVICASAGNHAQGVAFSARKLGCRATIVMPTTTPNIKVDAVKRMGGNVVLAGDTYSDAATHAQELVKTTGAVHIHPYDDPYVIAGQGTIGMEILAQLGSKRKDLHAIFIPVGGGGLLAGVGVYVKQICPHVKIIGVEPYEANAMYLSLKERKRVKLDTVGAFADGVAVKQVGSETMRMAQLYCDEMILVDTDAICAAIKDMFEETRTMLEPSGALSVAGMRAYINREKLNGKSMVAIMSGANINFDRLGYVLERLSYGEITEVVLGIIVPETPGALRKLLSILTVDGQSLNITQFHSRYQNDQSAFVYMAVMMSRERKLELIQRINSSDIQKVYAQDFTNDEFAKKYLQFIASTRSDKNFIPENQKLFCFSIPEGPGALGTFLDKMQFRFNISMFHYSKEHSSTGRVLLGLQIPPHQISEFKQLADSMGYFYEDESKLAVTSHLLSKLTSTTSSSSSSSSSSSAKL